MKKWIGSCGCALSAAVSMGDANIETNGIRLHKSDEYKHLAFLIQEDGIVVPLCSKDGNEYSICIAAYVDGEELPLKDMGEQVRAEWKATIGVSDE